MKTLKPHIEVSALAITYISVRGRASKLEGITRHYYVDDTWEIVTDSYQRLLHLHINDHVHGAAVVELDYGPLGEVLVSSFDDEVWPTARQAIRKALAVYLVAE